MDWLRSMIEQARQEGFLSRQDWEQLYAAAVSGKGPADDTDMSSLSALIVLITAGEIQVEGLSPNEVIQRLSVFT